MAGTETGWLIELKPSVVTRPTYWGAYIDGDLEWSMDHNLAIRFTRQKDAEKVIQYYGWTEAHAIEHQWG